MICDRFIIVPFRIRTVSKRICLILQGLSAERKQTPQNCWKPKETIGIKVLKKNNLRASHAGGHRFESCRAQHSFEIGIEKQFVDAFGRLSRVFIWVTSFYVRSAQRAARTASGGSVRRSRRITAWGAPQVEVEAR